jgi:hypothetical protein
VTEPAVETPAETAPEPEQAQESSEGESAAPEVPEPAAPVDHKGLLEELAGRIRGSAPLDDVLAWLSSHGL